MSKSLIHDNPKPSETLNFSNHSNQIEKPSYNTITPPRRAPRMSEPLMQESSRPQMGGYDFRETASTLNSSESLNESPNLPKRYKDPKEFENNFFKNKQAESRSPTEEPTKK